MDTVVRPQCATSMVCLRRQRRYRYSKHTHTHTRTHTHHNRRLTKVQIKMLDERMSRTVWPHYIDRMFYNGHSFWTRPNRIWKMIRKVRLLYYILPTQLRGVVPAVRHALRTFVWAMRRLEGQVYSYDEAVRLNLLPGSRAVDKARIKKMHADLVLGLVLLEGCLPTSHLNPGMHHFVHYAEYVRTHGPLRIFWMMAFERLVHAYNQHNMCHEHILNCIECTFLQVQQVPKTFSA